jgi:hypothetical protein
LVTTSFEDLFSVALSLFRNTEWTPRFLFTDEDNNPIDISLSNLAMLICPLNSDQSVGAPVVVTSSYSIDTDGAAVFSITGLGALSPAGLYQWFLMQSIFGQATPQVVAAGPLTVWDSPAFAFPTKGK